jgi:hypothetical protein
MATTKAYRKHYKGHGIVWSVKSNTYYITKNGKKVYKADYVSDAKSWIDRNS